jgi:enoyl-CoA hydratase
MTYETIKFERDGAVAVVRLNRPDRMNAVIEQMYRDLQAALRIVDRDDGLRALVLTGSVHVKDGVEKQAFCAGADIKKHSAGERTVAQKREYILLAHETMRMLHTLPVPVIAAVNGPARGAGSEMAVACDLVFMAGSSTIAFPETGMGTFVGGGATYHLPRLVGIARARELIYSGRVLDGPEAFQIGLAVRCLPLDELMDGAMDFARTLAARAPISMRFAKRYLNGSASLDFERVLRLEAEAILTCMETRDWHEGIRAFEERRDPSFEGD